MGLGMELQNQAWVPYWTDLPDANHAVLNESIRKVMKLPPQTQLLPGHGNPSTLEEEMQNNPYVREAMEEQHRDSL